MGRDGHESEPILDSNPFYVQRRVPQDVSWRWIYLISMVLSAVGGIYALTHRNKDFSVLASADYLSDPAHCPVIPAGRTRSLLANDDEDFKPTYFLEAAGLCTGVSIVGGLLIGLLALYLIRSKPHAMVGASVAMQVTLPAAAGVAVLAAGGGAASVPLFLTAGLIGFVFYLYRNQLALVGRLLGVSSRALYDNPSIIGGSLLIQLAGLIFVLPLLAGMLLAYANGGVAPNPAVQSRQGTSCLDGQGQEVLCCAWKPDDWAIAYMAWAAVTLSWTSLLAFTIKVFVISGVTAQWYFAPANQTPRGSLRRSIGHALGPQFGSLALAAWLLNLLNTLKQMAENARQENRNNLFVQILVSCLQFLITVLEYITKFGVVRIAITGEELMDGCRATVDLLRRNLLDTVGVWWFPGMILQVGYLEAYSLVGKGCCILCRSPCIYNRLLALLRNVRVTASSSRTSAGAQHSAPCICNAPAPLGMQAISLLLPGMLCPNV
eukprot:GHRR01011190.1.p1 GENE.GHRR01011190.1~~GHRR01011190.1.p1  ORF type:complete len:492 (+),score=143.83 GHRR01011190.1:253-1728(+)